MSCYADSHKNNAGCVDTRPTTLVFRITGCSSGTGVETGRAIAATGAKVFLTRSPMLNVLIYNAAVMQIPTLYHQINYLGHFLLFDLFKDAILKALTPECNSRLKHDVYSSWKAYGQSKLAQIYIANYVNRKFGPFDLHALSLMPRGILSGSPEQGAATTLAAVSKEWQGRGDKYLEDCKVTLHEPLVQVTMGFKPYYAYDEAKEAKL
ncbi:short chain dehydrogenase [Xylariaceae sp. FL1651]|nr:short chain dehydrogenase [Xylariaceae sp. FL1651]